ncbi:BF2992 family fimbrillin-A clan protein [Flavobacterium psychrotolerans]|uniref:Lipoprotein n=1 Tax=Flavobacterium psychrotolerans TaxID=2169410 RepID=A0A2U1JI92_9FLAO|nr:BF2992 family fimbrillin-A clan protein [Flavobacterium psychrotolerans]PWA04735.1 hypothetical protein DB895_09610 [Flavobacterium psychrotolerans]
MRKIKLITTLLLFFAALSITSCSDEPIDPSINLNTGGGSSTGDFWPTAINNEWVFKLNGNVQESMKIVSMNTLGNNTYYTFNKVSGSASGTQRIRKSNGDYYLKMEDVSTAGATTTGSETILLKDYLLVGGTWNDSYVQTTTYSGIPPIALNVSTVSTIIEKDATLSINGKTYNNVIKIKRIQTVSGISSPSSSTTSYYWFAKDVGPVKMTNEFNSQVTTQELFSYKLN